METLVLIQEITSLELFILQSFIVGIIFLVISDIFLILFWLGIKKDH